MSTILDVRHPRKGRAPLVPEDPHVRRVLWLAVAFFVSGLAFFIVRIDASRTALDTVVPIRQESRPMVDAPRTPLSDLPLPSSFHMFQFHAGMQDVETTIHCEDRLAVVMLFPSGSDYRADPQSALYNVASPCTKGAETTTALPLASLPLVDGNRYYIVRAQQGDSTWYNPY